ncbi:MAG: PilZ domain-containing protein [Candidatus Acidiferrales bacterium]
MTDSAASIDPDAQKRRSTRIVQAVPITVTGVDALGQPFKERTTTVMVNCHGCKYQSKHYVPKNSMVTLEVPRPEAGQKRTTQGRVVWVQRPRTVRELFQIGLEFEVPGNVWGIAFPPEDWFSSPYEAGVETSKPVAAHEPKLSVAPPSAVPASSAPTAVPRGPKTETPHAVLRTPASTPTKPAMPEQQVSVASGLSGTGTPAAPRTPQELLSQKPPVATVPPPPQDLTTPTAASAPLGAGDEGKIHVVPPASAELQGPLARQMAQMVDEVKEKLDKSLRRGAEAAITEEMAIARQQLDVQLHEAIERAIKVSMERVSESSVRKVIQQATDRTSAIVEEARKATEASAIHLDEKIREAVQQAVSGAADQAAQQAAEQAAEKTAAHSLKQAVDEAVDRALVERAASTPSLEILSSPEAAQQHLDQWRKNLEETAQNVRAQTVERSQAEIAAANQRWQQQFEERLAGASNEFDEKVTQASNKIGEKISEVSQQAIAHAEQNVRERSQSLRASLDEAIDGAASTIESLGNSLKQERDRAEQTKSQLQDAARVTLEQTRQHLDELLAKQQEEIARRADQVIAERAQQIEPALDASAQKVLARVSAELDQRITPKLEAVEGLASRLDNVEQQAANLQNHIREQMRQATEHAAQLQNSIREQAQQSSQQVIQETLQQLRTESSKVPAEVEEACRASLSKVQEDLQQKSTETQHETYEALSKASEWYQKKAQTTMQGSLEKAVEQSTTALRDRAAEVSSMLASELDHYRRTYVEHSTAQIEDAASEIVSREREKLNETSQIATATFSDQVQRVTTESLRRFEVSSRLALEKARSDMEFNREGSLAEFQQKMDERMMEGVEQARTFLQSQLAPLIETWEEKREVEKEEWMQQLKKSTEESIEEYKARLENASNSWLLASATTLGQHSQAVLDTIAKAAEKRLRETCSQVLAGMGDTLKEKLLGISTDFNTEEDQEPPKHKK